MPTKLWLTYLVFGFEILSHASLYNSGALSGGIIPDNNTIGLTSSIDLSGSGQDPAISSFTLTFVLQGGDSTDLSGYLRLGNQTTSPYYDLTSLIRGQTLTGATTYSIDFSTPDFQTTFGDLNPNGTWTLYFADAVAGDQSTLNSWSLQITAVPEPATLALAVFAGGLAVAAMVGKWKRAVKTDNARP